ncbi:MAG: hypothetical protein QOH21_3706, partial [Acidobacteriota bacterium]|nr:hypothetical protein [Acidobacteriota bacterium]
MSSEPLADRLGRLTPEQRALLLRSLPSQAPGRTSVPRRDPSQPLALSPAQLRMWFLERVQAENAGGYNVYDYQRLLGPLDETALLRAFREIVRRHEALRTSFVAVDGLPRQQVAEEVDFDFDSYDAADEAAVQQIVDGEPLRPFDLTTAPLMRVALIRVGEAVPR